MEENVTQIFANSIFEKHYECYKNLWIETIKQQAGQVEQVSSDYQGRVIYELLQNAFDKAEKKILVKVIGNVLYIANDGIKFNFTAQYDYKKNSTERGDFQSLCSISTSTKNATTSIGNKEVGFKSAFSIAEDGFVNIHTQGNILQKGKTDIEEKISFRIYDSFKSIESIPKEFDSEVTENLKEKIILVQQEFKGRGVPGFYFPLQINNKDEIINELFEDFVTVVEIPFNPLNELTVQSLFDEIEKIHFQFIRLKYDKNFEIKIDFRNKVYNQKVEKKVKALFSVELKNEELIQLARKINIEIEKPIIAFYINYNTDGVLFNYLPSKVFSPFKNIDFHADFQTKVDRTNINFDKNSDVGKYNRALLHACIELLFLAINNYLDIDERIDLNFKWLDKSIIQNKKIVFDWRLFELNNPNEIFNEVKSILKICDWQYTTASDLITRLANKYFNDKRTIEEYTLFYDLISKFLEHFTSNTSQYYIWVERFKDVLAPKLLSVNCSLLPNIVLSNTKEIFYKKSNDSKLELPNFINVSVTDYEIKDKYLRKKLCVKDFEDYNEILKYFKQVSYSGIFETDRLAESQQIELLKSLVQIMDSKKEVFTTSSHRYTRTFTADDRKNNSVVNQAYFNISTVFLKTTSNKYKPAQLCRKIDLDLDFLNLLNLGDSLDTFLMFIGVSLDNNYLFTDKRIFDSLNSGIEFIPILYKRNESVEKLYGEALLKNIRVVNLKYKRIHPAIIDKNNYNFLENISNRNIDAELDNLRAGKYEYYPNEYLNILFEKIKDFPTGIERLYLRLFYPFHKSLNKYLTITKTEFDWKQKGDKFFIAQNRQDFETLKKYDITLLYYFNGNDLPDDLKARKVSLTEGEIKAKEPIEISSKIKELLNSKMIYLFAAISNTTLSELNYKENSYRIKEIHELLIGVQAFNCKGLSREIICNEANLIFENKTDALCDRANKKIYFTENCSTKNKAELIAKYLFNNTSIASELELILFFKELSELEVDFPKEDIYLFRKLWIKDYDKKLFKFQTELLNGYIDKTIEIPLNWYIYNKFYKSDIILSLYIEGKLNEIEQKIEILKQNYDNVFDDFTLEIDYTLNDSTISKMIMFIESQETEESQELVDELKHLTTSIGMEDRIKEIERIIIEKYPFFLYKDINKEDLESTNQKLDLERKVSNIFNKLPFLNSMTKSDFNAQGEIITENLNVKKKRLIFQGKGSPLENEKYLVDTGANGEIQILGYYIGEFLSLQFDERISAIKETYEVIRKKLGNDSHLKFKDECLCAIKNNDDESLKKALIPYMYIALNHKFAFFDLIAYKNGKPTIVEVKTTLSNNNNSFFISKAEVDEAREEPFYEIIRVAHSEIIFMGNPVKELGDKLISISGDNYKLIPRNFKFEFSKTSKYDQPNK